MARKIALLIGVSHYGAGLTSLRCPTNGAAAMRSVLSNPDIGGFDEVITLFDPDVGEMRSRISEVFVKLTKQDLVLFYFTGHGIKDMTGDFYLTSAQTELFSNGAPNAGTAVEAHFLRRELSNCVAERKVVILDCCFGAAFADGFMTMSDENVDIEAQLGGKGWCILTSSTSSRYALEQKGELLSVYTRYLVEGLKTGGAAPDGQDFISAQNLHEYIVTQVEVAAPAMKPAIFNGQQGYNIVIASVRISNEQRYRKQVQRKVNNGTIGPAALAVLGQWQRQLQLSAQQAKAIEDEILQPYRERQQHLALYTKALEAEKSFSYPLNEVAVQDLKDLQRLLSLRDEDVQSVEQQVLGDRVRTVTRQKKHPIREQKTVLTTPESTLPTNPLITQTARPQKTRPQKTSSQSTRPQNTKTQPINQQTTNAQTVKTKAIKAQTVNKPQGRTARPSKPVVSRSLQFQPARFQTLRVDARGKIIQRRQGIATTFIETLGDGVHLTMVKIPGGKFVMGAPPSEQEAKNNEYPQREITVPEFWMGQCAITQGQWKALMGPKVITSEALSPTTHPMKKPKQPVDHLFWTDAVAFCQRLSERTGRDYRLPSSPQWEYACRAGTTTPFHFGETLTPALANYNGNYSYRQGPKGVFRAQTTEVGSFCPNDFGLYDMHGNVWEWCLDGWQGFEPNSATEVNLRKLAGQKKALRGGSWFYLPTSCRSAFQLTYPFHNRTDDTGFRVVCML